MATANVTADTTAQALFTTPKVKKGKLSSLKIDNQSGAPRTVRLQDIFTPDPSNGTPSPVLTTEERLQVTVAAGATYSLSEEDLKDVEMLGDAKAIADGIAAACVIIVGYHFE